MNTLSDALTIGMVLALVFGALCFYLYSRIAQMEKRVGLTENILLDLKMATENTLMSMSMSQQDSHEQYHRVEPISGPTPIEKEEVENITDEDFYKSVLQQASQEVPLAVSTTAVEVNYEAMSLKELKSLSKERSIHITKDMNKKDFIVALKRSDTGQPQQQPKVAEPLAGSEGSNGKPEDGFPVDLGQNANQED
jgi:hypothetical protein